MKRSVLKLRNQSNIHKAKNSCQRFTEPKLIACKHQKPKPLYSNNTVLPKVSKIKTLNEYKGYYVDLVFLQINKLKSSRSHMFTSVSLSLFSSFVNVYKTVAHVINHCNCKLITIEKNPGPNSIDETKTICASFSQSEVSIFGANAGSQCVAMSCCYLIFVSERAIDSYKDLDRIMMLGNELYTFLSNSCRQTFLLLSELPEIITIDENTYELNYSESYTSTLTSVNTMDNFAYTLPLKISLERLINEGFCNFLLTINSSTVAFNLINGSNQIFKIFDSHARDAHGMSNPLGSCVLLEVNGIEKLVEYFETVSSTNAIFELIGVHIIVQSSHSENTNVKKDHLSTEDSSSSAANFLHTNDLASREKAQINSHFVLSFAVSFYAICFSVLKPCSYWKSRPFTMSSIVHHAKQFFLQHLSSYNHDQWPVVHSFKTLTIYGSVVNVECNASTKVHFCSKSQSDIEQFISQNKHLTGFVIYTTFSYIACIIHRTKRKTVYFIVSLKENNAIGISETCNIDILVPLIYNALNITNSPDQHTTCYIEGLLCSVNNLTRKQRSEVLKKHSKRKVSTTSKNFAEFEPSFKKAHVEKGNTSFDINKCISNFQNKIREGPFYICTVCHRFLYKRSVVILVRAKYKLDYLFTGKVSYDNNEYICKTCQNKITKQKIPCQAVYNKLVIDDAPAELQCLEKLEQILVAQRIVFEKIVIMPKGQQRKVKGAICNVPVDCDQTCKVLPRPPETSGIILLKLKRKMQYTGHVYFQPVRPDVISNALFWLKKNNPLYADIDIDLNNIESDLLHFGDDNDSQNTSMSVLQNSLDNELSDKQSENEVEDPLSQLRAPTIETCLQSTIPDYPVRLEQTAPSLGNEIYDIAPGENKHPVSFMLDSQCEELAFPVLFPNGRFGYKVQRDVPLSPVKYFNARLLNHSGKFASNPEYLFFAQFVIEQKKVSDSINIALKKLQGQSITASNLKHNTQQLQNLIYHDQAYLFLRNIPGTPPYWQKFMYEVLAMIKQLGIPTWFMTLSCADLRWNDLFQIIAKSKGMDLSQSDIDALSYNERCSLLNHNPVLVAKHFQYRVETFFTEILLSNAHPIGKITYYALRIEFQMRGSPHLHSLIWTSDCPKLSRENKDDFIDFINSHVQAFLPEKTLDSQLHELVNTYQKHCHSKTCQKYKNVQCRFNFGQYFSNRTVIAEPLPENMDEITKSGILKKRAEILSQVKEKIDKSLNPSTNDYEHELTEKDILASLQISEQDYYGALSISPDSDFELHLKRPVDSCFINNYFIAGLKGFQANIDLQPVFNHYKCVTYVCSYFTKDETECSQAIVNAAKEAKELNLSTKDTLRKVGAAFLSTREVSSQECAYRCMPELWMKKTFPSSIFIATDLPKNRIRIAKSKQELDDLPDDSTDIYKSNIIVRYSLRPQSNPVINSLCLAQFASYYYKEYKSECYETADAQPTILTDAVIQSQTEPDLILPSKIRLSNNEVMKCRTIKAVIRYHVPNKTKDPEKYCHHLLFLYYPWTQESSLIGRDNSYASKFCEPNVQTIVEQNRLVFEPDGDAVIDALNSMRNHPNEFLFSLDSINDQENADIAAEIMTESLADESFNEQLPFELAQSSNQTSSVISAHCHPTEITDDALRQSVRSLNSKQRQVYDKILSWSRNTVKNMNTLRPQEVKPLYIFISGPGGTGKSHLIKAIYHTVQKTFRHCNRNPDLQTVLLMAPTGIAAINISGTTINTALAIPKHSGENLPAMSDQTKTHLRIALKELKLLIIDEISMVSNCMLLHIHQRLKEIFGTPSSQMFAGLSLLVLGDLHQLPPIRRKPVFEQFRNPMHNLCHPWLLFSLIELTEIMRQKDAKSFVDLLNRFRTASQTKDDIDTINTRFITPSDSNYPSDALHIWAENAPVTDHNRNKLTQINAPLFVLKAVDHYPANVSQKDIDLILSRGRSETGGLDSEIHIKVGARVMLTTNIDINDRLTNGQMGIINNIYVCQVSNKVKTIFIKFDDTHAGKTLMQKYQSNQLVRDHNVVPIEPILAKIKFNPNKPSSPELQRVQFPIALSWACTVHKVQGLTLDNVVISFELFKQRNFNFGQVYVALSRSRSLKGIHVLNHIENKHVKVDHRVCTEYERLKAASSMNTVTYTNNLLDGTVFHICLINIRSLRKHFLDIKHDSNIFDCDLIALTETQLLCGDSDEDIRVQLNPHTLYRQDHSTDKFCSLAICKRNNVCSIQQQQYFPTINAWKFVLYNIINQKSLICLLLYKKNCFHITEFTNQLSTVLTNNTIDMIFGDFNVNYFDDQKIESLRTLMESFNYIQVVENPTFISSGTLLDHIYVAQPVCSSIIANSVVSVYYSDHDAVKLSICL